MTWNIGFRWTQTDNGVEFEILKQKYTRCAADIDCSLLLPPTSSQWRNCSSSDYIISIFTTMVGKALAVTIILLTSAYTVHCQLHDHGNTRAITRQDCVWAEYTVCRIIYNSPWTWSMAALVAKCGAKPAKPSLVPFPSPHHHPSLLHFGGISQFPNILPSPKPKEVLIIERAYCRPGARAEPDYKTIFTARQHSLLCRALY